MDYQVTVETLPEQTIASVRCHAHLTTVGIDVAGGLKSMMHDLAASGGEAGGVPFLIIHDIDDMLDAGTPGTVEICVPISRPPADEHILLSPLAATSAAVTVHYGGCGRLPSAYAAVAEWIDRNGREARGSPRQSCLPQSASPDTAVWLAWPIW